MKKLFFVLGLGCMSLVAMSFTPTNEINESKEEVTLTSAEEDALFCKVEAGGLTVTCWFCNCAELLDALGGDDKD